MKLLPSSPRIGHRDPAQRGAALMMAFWVLLIIILIVAQIGRATNTGARVSRNEEVLLAMDLAIESVLLQVYEDLAIDGEAAAGEGGVPGLPGGIPGVGSSGGGGALATGTADGGQGGGGEGGEGPAASDSREDEWARPQRTELNGIRLRVLIQDEDSKFNLLSILTENEDEAEKAFERLVRVLEYARGDTEAEIDSGNARQMADEIREFLVARRDQVLPRPQLLTDDPEEDDMGLLLSPRELVALDAFQEDDFRDFRDERGTVVHSLGTFLTVWSSVATVDDAAAAAADPSGTVAPVGDDEGEDGEEDGDEGQPGPGGQSGAPGQLGQGGDGTGQGQGPGQEGQGGAPGVGGTGQGGSTTGGGRVNVNTAPLAVLRALFDDSDVSDRFWAEVLEYRNTPDEEIEENDDPPLDEFGEEITVKQFFDSLEELSELDDWLDVDPLVQAEMRNLLTTQSQVFSIYVTARRPTGLEADAPPPIDKRDLLEQEESGQGLVRTVRSVVWRRPGPDGKYQIVPLERWEVVDYVPIEVRDYPDEDDDSYR